MSTVYVDTSVLGRVLLDEPDKRAIQHALDSFDQVASRLLRVELRRVAMREGLLDRADLLLRNVSLMPLDETTLASAESIPPATVATLDSIHLATAVRMAKAGDLDAIMTYDKSLAAGAQTHGLQVLSPA